MLSLFIVAVFIVLVCISHVMSSKWPSVVPGLDAHMKGSMTVVAMW